MSKELIEFIQNEPYADVQETLNFLLEECSIDDLPTDDEIVLWIDILQQRGGKFTKLAGACQAFLQEISS